MSRLSTIVLCVLLAGAAGADNLMPRIVHEACTELKSGEPFVILARFEDESQLFDPKVIYRTRTDSHWKHAPFTKEPGKETFRAEIPARTLRGGPLEYFIEVFDEYGNGPARMGSPDAPIQVEPAREPAECVQIPRVESALAVTPGSQNRTGLTEQGPPPPADACDRDEPPLYCSAWFWVTIGAVVAGGTATGVYFLVSGDEGGAPPSDSVTLTVTGASPTGAP